MRVYTRCSAWQAARLTSALRSPTNAATRPTHTLHSLIHSFDHFFIHKLIHPCTFVQQFPTGKPIYLTLGLFVGQGQNGIVFFSFVYTCSLK